MVALEIVARRGRRQAVVRAGQVEVHGRDVIMTESLRKVWELGILRIDTDCPEQALAFRRERNQ